MTLKRYFLFFAAALATLACSPEAQPSPEPIENNEENPEAEEKENVFADVRIEDIIDVSSSEATLCGSYGRASGVPDEAGFQWGTSAAELDGTVQYARSLSGQAGRFSVVLGGLSPETEYYICAYVKLDGEYVFSDIESFITAADGGGEGDGGGSEEKDEAPYLACYEVPALTLSDSPVECGQERWGNTNWYRYDTDNADRKVVVHTYRNGRQKNGKIIRTYTILFDRTKKAALWDCTVFNSDDWQRNKVGRNESWQYDPALDASWQNSGVSGYSKGHLTASNDRQDNEDANHQTFYYSNQAPQYQTGFNDGVWNTLEQKIQDASPVGCDTLYVVNGLLYESDKTVSGVPIPSHFYKCIMYCTFDSEGTMTDARGTAFMYTNERQTESWNDSKFVFTIDALEARSGFDFFPNVPDEFEIPAENGTRKYSL